MNPIPHGGAIPTTSIFLNGYLELLMVVTVAALLIVFGAMLWPALRSVTRERSRVFCPVRLRPARVLFGLRPDGTRADVLRCSVFGRRPITCGKACLRPTAPA